MSKPRKTSGLKSALQRVLVIANSGRMLANAARSAGYMPLVIDLFADQDTEVIAEQVWQVKNLSLGVIPGAVESCLLSYKVQWLIYGSGLEIHPETLEYLSGRFSVMGNDVSVIKHLNAKKTFFKQLDTLGIRYPEVQFHPPENSVGWLIKPVNHVGGLGIRSCDRQALNDEYYQKFCQGKAGSALFCSDGEQFELIGFHRQWTLAQDDFAFAGIIRDEFLPEEQQKSLGKWIKKLVSFYHLKGLASLDFIYDGTSCYFLEINPRPPASMMLYPELDLLSAHLTGQKIEAEQDKIIRALQIVYAKQPCKIQPGIEWPEWSFDRPKLKSCIQVGQPICSIMARGKTDQQTLAELKVREIQIENIIK
ncbi:ATP-dependent carboxylate-amine ligase [Methylococcaceae bacterium HT4]|nr:ATP-grasp domain-containing protein [Methyloprofundus sp.]TXK96396.1 ATP-dependent carboxylate-amine ligase [Methylococcaceae bacterium CS4]TXK97116.1 ATP-dependent carboxylate-amine ligase [Methylococcaceae bacterium CS5]TXL06011.1 ATP-dependent carboxylate-amine ligase [Methylococcaceae bacterium CS3]TXL06336.1 ATP-dependent carboxylate-amine ligase [Methylococcaceae bacterium CS1]TXL11643.1 ATP-dependent carboxylate-amine ligase [Methylococcaceae bacterium CS2]TXL14111.1 ATP-dependent c